MNSLGGAESANEAEIADHLLRFSRAFYDGFRVRNNRLRFWRMLFLILDKEAHGPIKDSSTAEEINSILRWSRPPEELARWRRQLVKQFADDRASFLEVIGEDFPLSYLRQSTKREVAHPKPRS